YAQGKNYRFPDQMARLQVSYDCWLEQVEENIQPDHIMKCRDMFYDALNNMKEAPPSGPPPAPATITLYFDNNSASIPLGEAQKLEQAVRNPNISHIEVLVEGYADTLDKTNHNLGLSKRRAEAVVNAIRALDTGITDIKIKAFGETNLAVPTADNTA